MYCYYFGCRRPGTLGHYWFDRHGERLAPKPHGTSPRGVPWAYVDGKLNPSHRQGDAAIHHKDGWTALAFEDHSVDVRPGSNSVFVFEELLTFDAAVEKARRCFPWVWARFSFEVTYGG